MAKKVKFVPLPRTVYVGISNPHSKDDRYLSAHEDPEMVTNLEGNPGDVMGEYKLVRVIRVRKETQTFLDEIKSPSSK